MCEWQGYTTVWDKITSDTLAEDMIGFSDEAVISDILTE
jgi:hypothetical protein